MRPRLGTWRYARPALRYARASGRREESWALVLLFWPGTTHGFQIGRQLLLGRLGIANRENPYLAPGILYLKGLRPRKQLIQSGINLLDDLLDGDIRVHEPKIEDETV